MVDDLENPSSAVVAEVPRPLDEECDVELDEAKCRDFEMKMGKLEELANSAKTINYQIKYEILKLQGFPVASTMASAAAVSSSNYQEAKAAAEAAAKTHGANSKEAAVAWEAVFEIVSAADDDKVPMGSLEDVVRERTTESDLMRALRLFLWHFALRRFRPRSQCLLDSASAKCVEYTTAMDQLKAAIKNKELA